MKRYAPWIACAGGILALALLLPRFDATQPQGVRVTRGEAQRIGDDAVRTQLGEDPGRLWSALTWDMSRMLARELERDPQRLVAAQSDPVIGPRLGSYHVSYYQYHVPKQPEFIAVSVDARTGKVIGARLRPRQEVAGAHATEAQLRGRADAFVHAHLFPGAPDPQFESARPNILRTRTDWVFRYRVPSRFPAGKVVPLLAVYFAGDRFAGWELIEEYSDGRSETGDSGSEIAVTLARLAMMFGGLLILIAVFLRKYHAGEVGVGTGSLLFALTLALLIVCDLVIRGPAAEGLGLGYVDARMTSWAQMGFKLVLTDLPTALLLFLGWAVGESFARERWGERLASFDAILRRDPVNATVGRSVLYGVLAAPAVAAAALLVAFIGIALGFARQNLGDGSQHILFLGGPIVPLFLSAIDALLYPVVAMLAPLAFAARRRVLWLGILVAIAIGAGGGLCTPPISPAAARVLFGFGGMAAAVAVFLAWDLLAAVMAVFGGALLLETLPLLRASTGELYDGIVLATALPLLVAIAFAVAGLMTAREVVYRYEDLAPHVKRIVERERVKAEIDAANRIQAALLPLDVPELTGASVASHYRAATEIGGDYFDFLPQRNGEIGIAFGDVSGHGLTSGIVMAMAKAALLVQAGVDPSPRVVLEVLNDVVIRTAPKRILMTFFFGLLDPATHTLRFSSAGHLDPYVYRAASRRVEPLSSWGFPLGVRRREPFREHIVDLYPGDRLILYSDGLIEAVDDDGEPFGFERFERVLAECGHLSAEDIKKSLLGAVRKFTRNRPPEDDQTLVVVSFEEAVSEPAFARRGRAAGAA
jgi:Stage II sporulation protein E (SpoIIE)